MDHTSFKKAVNYAFTRLGLFGGAAVDFYSMGYQAGKMVVQILKGESPGDIAIKTSVGRDVVWSWFLSK